MVTKVPDPYDIVEDFRDGRPLDYATAALQVDCETELGYRCTLIQGIGGADASAGTHTKGRMGDWASWDGRRKMLVVRRKGGIGWERAEQPGVWGPHCHWGSIFVSRSNRRGISASGYAQIGKYDRVEDGLANPPTPDPMPFRPDPKVVFSLERYRWVMRNYGLDGVRDLRPTRITRIRDRAVLEHHDLGELIAMMKAVPEGEDDRRAFDAEIKALQHDRNKIEQWLETWPKR